MLRNVCLPDSISLSDHGTRIWIRSIHYVADAYASLVFIAMVSALIIWIDSFRLDWSEALIGTFTFEEGELG